MTRRGLERALKRIRAHRFVFVNVRFAEPHGRPRWIIEGVPLRGDAEALSTDRDLRKALERALVVADTYWTKTGERTDTPCPVCQHIHDMVCLVPVRDKRPFFCGCTVRRATQEAR